MDAKLQGRWKPEPRISLSWNTFYCNSFIITHQWNNRQKKLQQRRNVEHFQSDNIGPSVKICIDQIDPIVTHCISFNCISLNCISFNCISFSMWVKELSATIKEADGFNQRRNINSRTISNLNRNWFTVGLDPIDPRTVCFILSVLPEWCDRRAYWTWNINKIVNSRYREQFPILTRIDPRESRSDGSPNTRGNGPLVTGARQARRDCARQKDTVGRIETEADTIGSG